MKAADAIASILRAEGVEFLFAYPGNPIIEAAAVAGIRTIIVRQERVGLHMADAIARLSSGRKIGVFAMQHGPGAENAFGGIAQAFGESAPILVLPMGYARKIAHVKPNFNSVLNMQHISTFAEPVTEANEIPHVLRRAFSQLRNGRGGPAVVEVPSDVFAEEVAPFTYRPPPAVRMGPDPARVAVVAELLRGAKRPVIYAGQGVHYAEAWPQLLRLAERLSAPTMTSLNGKSAFPENHPLALGAAGRAVPGTLRHFLEGADVILGIGCSFTSTVFGIPMPAGKRIIHATLDPTDLNKDVESEEVLLGDAGLVLDALLAALGTDDAEPARDRDSVAAEIKKVRERWLLDWTPHRTSTAAPLSPFRVLKDLEDTVDIDNTIITHDAGSPRDQLSPYWRAVKPLSYIGWGKTTQLGYGLGLALGAKLAHPDKLCINVWGDAAIGFTGMDFETAVRERIPILSILLNNFSMAIEIPKMKVATEKFGATNISGDYAAMARAFGGYGERITLPEEIVPAIRRGIEQTEMGVPVLLEFITNTEYLYSMY